MPRYTKRKFDILFNGRTIDLTLGIYKKGHFKFIFEDSTVHVARHAVDRFIERKEIEGGRFAYKLLFQILADNYAQICKSAKINVQSKEFKLEYDDFIYVFKNRGGDSPDPLLDFILITCYGKADKKVLVKPLIPMELEIYNEMKKRDKQIEKRVPKFKLYKRR